jgi:hypothetical protein
MDSTPVVNANMSTLAVAIAASPLCTVTTRGVPMSADTSAGPATRPSSALT